MNHQTESAVAVVAALFLLVSGVVGGVLPQYIKLSDRGLHRFLALGTGMLLGTIFYHMLPEALAGQAAATFVLVGLLGVFVVERLIFARPGRHHAHGEGQGGGLEGDHSGHELIGVTAFAGLSVHALMVGLGLAAQLADPDARVPLLTSLLVHKLSEAFSLSTIFLLAGYARPKALLMMIIFACIEPFGVLMGSIALGVLPTGWEGGAAGLAAGTFLYVALCDLLPEVFHRSDGRWASLAMLVIGIALIGGMMAMGGHGHGH